MKKKSDSNLNIRPIKVVTIGKVLGKTLGKVKDAVKYDAVLSGGISK